MPDIEFKKIKRIFESFRNISTCSPTQNLFDDIISSEHFDALGQHENASSNIDHSQDKSHRPFQYGDTGLSLYVFEKLKWSYGRFSNRNFGVWYGALEEEVSIHEVLYHRIREDKELFANKKIKENYIIHQRAMFKACCRSSSLVDLTNNKKIHHLLIDDGFSYCQRLGERAVREGVDVFLAPSARFQSGICTPIFNKEIIKDEFVYYFDLIIYRDFSVQIKKSKLDTLSFPKEWLD